MADSASSTVYLLSLGCAKNLVDSECMSWTLRMADYQMVEQPEDADYLIVNTCGFIRSAKQEAIDRILQMADHKQPAGRAKALIVCGCLAQRYAAEIKRDLPEVDAVLGTAQYDRIVDCLDALRSSGTWSVSPGAPGSILHLDAARQPSTSPTYAYVKIAEGCSNGCAYCAIPMIRGPHRSRSAASILEECRRLSADGCRELILIAQDLGRYGTDIPGGIGLSGLIRQICSLPDVSVVRLLYLYSDGIDDDLLRLFAEEPKLAHYLDMPIQHASDRMLKRMGRRDSQESIRKAVGALRQAAPDLILRTTVMLGFPGEEESDVAILEHFLSEIRFDRLGGFVFSAEEGTAAFSLKPKVSASIGQRRLRRVLRLQRDIAIRAARRRIGQVVPVALESVDDSGIFYLGRSYGEAPDVDPAIRVAAAEADIQLGGVYPVRLLNVDDLNLTGVTVS